MPVAGTSGPLSMAVSALSRATREASSTPLLGAKAIFCAATVPLLCSPAGGPPQIPLLGLLQVTGPVHAWRMA
jgi:hypothetical protein